MSSYSTCIHNSITESVFFCSFVVVEVGNLTVQCSHILIQAERLQEDTRYWYVTVKDLMATLIFFHTCCTCMIISSFSNSFLFCDLYMVEKIHIITMYTMSCQWPFFLDNWVFMTSLVCFFFYWHTLTLSCIHVFLCCCFCCHYDYVSWMVKMCLREFSHLLCTHRHTHTHTELFIMIMPTLMQTVTLTVS